ncbi:GNAT family N-acetyltransferase [Sphaerisporangium aureirubrum]|uniref:GNAT family N-acetyltransferase n=1 Tax=Sphaerisporangium aureirubrum TaxID=1544736 RepID=A0ABW1NUL0_9ACTN
MSGEITIVEATPEDADAVGEVHAAAWRAAYAPFFAPEFFAAAVEHRRTKWRAVIAEGKDTILLARMDGRPGAYSYFGESPSRPHVAEIFGFYAHPDLWGSGIAASLMTATLARLRHDAFTRVHLWTLRDTPQSHRFYTKTGFTNSGHTQDHDFGDGTPVPQIEYERTLHPQHT